MHKIRHSLSAFIVGSIVICSSILSFASSEVTLTMGFPKPGDNIHDDRGIVHHSLSETPVAETDEPSDVNSMEESIFPISGFVSPLKKNLKVEIRGLKTGVVLHAVPNAKGNFLAIGKPRDFIKEGKNSITVDVFENAKKITGTLVNFYCCGLNEAFGTIDHKNGGKIAVVDPDQEFFGAAIEVDSGKLSKDQNFTIYHSKASLPDPVPSEYLTVSPEISFGPPGANLTLEALISVPFRIEQLRTDTGLAQSPYYARDQDELIVRKKLNISGVKVLAWDSGKWRDIPVVDRSATIVRVRINKYYPRYIAVVKKPKS